MRKLCFIIGCFCILAFVVMPAQAFTAKTLTITLSPNGDAHASFQYDLSWMEQAAVFFQIANPTAELQTGLENEFGKPVTVNSFTTSSADVIIPSFAYVSQSGDSGSLVTPSFSFSRVQQAVNKYWFAKFISPNFTPEVTTIVFPDGYTETYYSRTTIPTIAHRLARGSSL